MRSGALPPSALTISQLRESDVVRLKLVGELDLATVPRLEERLNQLRKEKVGVRLDLSEVDFIDSSGIGLLYLAVQEARDGGFSIQVEPVLTPAVRRALGLVQLEDFIVANGQPVESAGGRQLSAGSSNSAHTS